MALLGTLDPRQQQEEQRRAQTAQSQHQAEELAKMLAEHGQKQEQPFTSPWQVAGQWAQALAGRNAMGRNAQTSAALNSLAAPGGDTAGAPAAPAPMGAAGPSQGAPEASMAPSGGSSKAAPFAPEIKQAIIEGAKAAGVDPNMMAVFAHIESGGNPRNVTHSYKGLMQLSDEEMARESGGKGDVFNPKDSTMAAGLIAKRNQAAYEKFTGRPASPFDVYMMHQQGPAGYLQHIGNPDAPAWENMHSTGEGRAKGPAWSKLAITNNGGHVGDTSGQFIDRWRGKFDRLSGGDHGAFAGAKTASLTTDALGGAPPAPGPVAPAAPSTPGAAPPAGAPPATSQPVPAGPQVAQAAPAAAAPAGQSSLMERGTFLDPRMLPQRPQPPYSLQQIQAAVRAGVMSPQDAAQHYKTLQEYSMPMTMPFGGGQIMYDPRNPSQQTYLPGIQTKPQKVGDIETQQSFWVDSQGRQHTMPNAPEAGAAPAAPSAPGAAPAAGGPPPFPAGGGMTDLANYGEQRKVRIKGEEETATETAKSHASVVKGVRGLGITGGKIKALTGDLMEIVGDPDWSKGGGAGATRQVLNRLGASLGISEEGATPRGVVDQASKLLALYGQEALKTGTSELGEAAGRVFQTEAEKIAEIMPTGNEAQHELIAKLKALNRLGAHWTDTADALDEHLGKRGGAPDASIHKLLRDRESGFHMYVPSELKGEKKEEKGAAPAAPSTSTTSGGLKWRVK